MAFQLDLIHMDGVTPVATRTHLSPQGLLGGFEWKWGRYGDCITLNFEAFADQLGVRNRQIVKLSIDGRPVFTGTVVECPHPRDPKRGTVACVGASELLTRRVIGPEVFENVDIAVIVRALLEKYRHPAITYDPTHVPMTGRVLRRFSMPWRKLWHALEALGKSIDGDRGVPFGVLPDGRFFFGFDLAPAVPIAYRDVKDLQYLRVNGNDAVTRNYMLTLSRASGTPYERATFATEEYLLDSGRSLLSESRQVTASYQPGTHVFMVDEPAYADAKLENATLIPAGADFLTPLDPATLTLDTAGMLNTPQVLDSDLATYAENDPAAQYRHLTLQQDANLDQNIMVGFRVVYSLDLSSISGGDYAPFAWLRYSLAREFPLPNGNIRRVDHVANFYFTVEPTSGGLVSDPSGPRELTAVLPMPAEHLATALGGAPFTLGTPTLGHVSFIIGVAERASSAVLPAGRFKVYTLQALGQDRVKLDTLARKALSPPAQEPTQFELPYLIGATPSVTLTGLPGGDLTADVVEIEGHHDPKGLTRSVVKLEQPGASQTSRVIRLVARERAADAQDELRSYLEGT